MVGMMSKNLARQSGHYAPILMMLQVAARLRPSSGSLRVPGQPPQKQVS